MTTTVFNADILSDYNRLKDRLDRETHSYSEGPGYWIYTPTCISLLRELKSDITQLGTSHIDLGIEYTPRGIITLEIRVVPVRGSNPLKVEQQLCNLLEEDPPLDIEPVISSMLCHLEKDVIEEVIDVSTPEEVLNKWVFFQSDIENRLYEIVSLREKLTDLLTLPVVILNKSRGKVARRYNALAKRLEKISNCADEHYII